MPATHLAPPRTPAERARDYLEARPAAHTSLDQLAAVVGVSKFHLVRVFRQRFGVPPHAYIMRLRLRYARALLLDGHAIREVSTAAGFADVSHFTREFKRAFGITPGQFRKEVAAPEAPAGTRGSPA